MTFSNVSGGFVLPQKQVPLKTRVTFGESEKQAEETQITNVPSQRKNLLMSALLALGLPLEGMQTANADHNVICDMFNNCIVPNGVIMNYPDPNNGVDYFLDHLWNDHRHGNTDSVIIHQDNDGDTVIIINRNTTSNSNQALEIIDRAYGRHRH